jgi:hypothetical protein
MRHDRFGAHLQSVCKALGIKTTETWYTHTQTPKPVCEHADRKLLWNQRVRTDKHVMANRPDIIIKNKKGKNMRTDRCGCTCGQKCHAKGSRKENKVHEFMYRDATKCEI